MQRSVYLGIVLLLLALAALVLSLFLPFASAYSAGSQKVLSGFEYWSLIIRRLNFISFDPGSTAGMTNLIGISSLLTSFFLIPAAAFLFAFLQASRFLRWNGAKFNPMTSTAIAGSAE